MVYLVILKSEQGGSGNAAANVDDDIHDIIKEVYEANLGYGSKTYASYEGFMTTRVHPATFLLDCTI